MFYVTCQTTYQIFANRPLPILFFNRLEKGEPKKGVEKLQPLTLLYSVGSIVNVFDGPFSSLIRDAIKSL